VRVAIFNDETDALDLLQSRLEQNGRANQIRRFLSGNQLWDAISEGVRAVKECPESAQFITVKAARKEDYLHIKVENASAEPKKASSRDRKSYGQEILRDIALQYSGEFLTDWKDGVYRAMLSLMAAKN
jgi:hypothetical protein